jgi:hypothetical protein
MASKRKRKSDQSSDGSETLKHPHPSTCILHVIGISDDGAFTSFSKARGESDEKLAHLLGIRDK